MIWHSVTQLYWPAAEIAAVRAALSGYGRDHRVGEVGMEYAPDGAAGEKPEVRTTLWWGDGARPGTGCSAPRTTTGSRFG